eukprot:SAG31_NODE_194_length_20722_cov_19.854192_21_plen_443_part_00
MAGKNGSNINLDILFRWTDAQRAHSSVTPMPTQTDPTRFPNVPGDGELWSRCSVVPDSQGGWPGYGLAETQTTPKRRQYQCVCSDANNVHDGGQRNQHRLLYKPGIIRMLEALRDGKVRVTNHSIHTDINSGRLDHVLPNQSSPLDLQLGSTLTKVAVHRGVLPAELRDVLHYIILPLVASNHRLSISSLRAIGIGSTGNTGIELTYRRNGAEERLICDKVILALPLGVLKANSIEFQPPLPEPKQAAIQSAGFGNRNTLVLVYANAWWPNATTVDRFQFARVGVNTRGFFTDWTSPFPAGGPPVLVTSASGPAAEIFELLADNDLLVAARRVLVALFGETVVPRVDQLVRFERTSWGQDPLSRGAYAYSAVGNHDPDWGQIALPVGGWLWFTGEVRSTALLTMQPNNRSDQNYHLLLIWMRMLIVAPGVRDQAAGHASGGI